MVISTNTQYTPTNNKHTCTYTNEETNMKHTLSAYWWQVLLLNLVVISVSLISGAADGSR